MLPYVTITTILFRQSLIPVIESCRSKRTTDPTIKHEAVTLAGMELHGSVSRTGVGDTTSVSYVLPVRTASRFDVWHGDDVRFRAIRSKDASATPTEQHPACDGVEPSI